MQKENKYVSILPSFEINPDKTALIMIDMQNFLMNKDFGLGKMMLERQPELAGPYFERMENIIIPNTKKLLQTFRDINLPIIHVTMGAHLNNRMDILPMRREGAISLEENSGIEGLKIPIVGTKEHDIHKELEPRKGEIILNKVTRSAFTSTGVDQILRNIGIKYIVLTGYATNACVNNTALDAADLGYKVILVDDACQGRKIETHNSVMNNFNENFGRVNLTSEVINEVKQNQ